MNRYSSGTFTGQYKATIGADFITKDVIVHTGGTDHAVTLQIWDTAGQERFQSLGVGFYRGADAAILTYDITDPISLEHLNHWKNEFLEHVGMIGTGGGVGAGNIGGAPFPFVVVGNKYDKDKKGRKIPFHRAEEWCRLNIISSSTMMGPYDTNYNASYYPSTSTTTSTNTLQHYETSAKTGWNVDEVFHEVARLALQYEEYRRSIQPQLFIPPPPSLSNGGGYNNTSYPYNTHNNNNNNIDLRRQNSSNSSSYSQSDKCC
jgi:Ras-related protein Rab-7A